MSVRSDTTPEWPRRWGRLAAIGAGIAVALALLLAIADEIATSRRQAAWFASLAHRLTYAVEAGPADAIRFPSAGPYDERLGYARLPQFVARLEREGFAVDAQARMSPALAAVADAGLFPPYREKAQAGLEMRDCRGRTLAATRVPQRVYERFEQVPPLLVEALLFVEDRSLLDARAPTRNPALDWRRLGRAALDQLLGAFDPAHPQPGASTLATQIEKFRHSPAGRTHSIPEKLRQMVSASLRAYLDGADTRARRRQIVIDYLNSVPLAAQAGFGEVHGLGDGLWAWFGRDWREVNRLLLEETDGLARSDEQLRRRALAFKQALALLIAQRRPSYYLAGTGAQPLAELTDSYLRLLAASGVIDAPLRDAALTAPLALRAQPVAQVPGSFVERKAVSAVRARLAALLDVPRAYDLDRLDLVVDTTLDGELQHAATRLLASLRQPAAARQAGLFGERLLGAGHDPGRLVFSFTLFEAAGHANLLRVQTDNFEQPFDVNEGARIDLGSTAKLRTLITYLELVERLHARFGPLAPAQLAAQPAPDALSRWARDYLLRAADRSLAPMLEAALARTYRADPSETFFTGGGVHRFANFDAAHDGRAFTVRDAFKQSVNLVFIRLMRDIVQHLTADSAAAAADPQQRQRVLARFADAEGRRLLARWHRSLAGLPPHEIEARLAQRMRADPARLASAFGALAPDAGVEELAAFLRRHLPGAALSEARLRALHERHVAARLALADRAYLAGVHPLELWLASHLRRDPAADLAQVIAAGAAARQEAYRWLFTTRQRSAQDVRIRIQLERDAFAEILRGWRRLGYPFESLTPSYATAIGASGDRPAALAELMGIVVNRGLRLPVVRLEALAFARATPYETRLARQVAAPERVLSEAVADAVRGALIEVVEDGTARRLRGAFGKATIVGGKTGTGDHRIESVGRDGRTLSSRVVSRSGTFVFLLGRRYFGAVTAYVPEPYAAAYRFTSALPVQVLKTLAPALEPLLTRGACEAGWE
jgi:membrane peptidoglycan carboxypeptidase